jgi:hypothetical protein
LVGEEVVVREVSCEDRRGTDLVDTVTVTYG